MKHIHETWAFLVKSGILQTFVYNVYGSQNEFVERVTRVFILRMRSLGQNGPLRRDTVLAVARIETHILKDQRLILKATTWVGLYLFSKHLG